MIATVTLNPSLDEWIELDALRSGQLNRSRRFARYPGGKGINVSRVVHELGGRTHALALAGGEDGAILEKLLARMAIPRTFVAVGGTTRNNYKILTAQPPALTEINTPGPRVALADLARLMRRLLRLRPAPRCAVFSGSLPPGAPASIYRRWIAALRRRGMPSVLDASGEALRQGCAARPWLIKPNRQEAEELLGARIGTSREAIRAARRLLALGPSAAILSLGREGAVLAAADPPGVWVAQPPRVRTVSAVGAGDSLVGGVVTGWAQGRPLPEAFRLGVASGTASAMTPGTELCHRAAVARLAPRVWVQRVG
jgi:1-phosphofructokinase family hexose kinase